MAIEITFYLLICHSRCSEIDYTNDTYLYCSSPLIQHLNNVCLYTISLFYYITIFYTIPLNIDSFKVSFTCTSLFIFPSCYCTLP